MNNIYHYVRSYMLGRKARLVAKEAHRKTGRLLDIGTGTGYFFRHDGSPGLESGGGGEKSAGT